MWSERKVSEMKWLAIAGVLLYLCRHSDAGALKCSPESQKPRCAENRDISPVQSLEETPPLPPSSAEAECLAGSEWESNCHYCRCSDTGVAECLKADACDFPVFAEPIKCKPNTTFERDCNVCTCLENGLGLCTLRECPPLERRKRDMPDTPCEPGSSWKEDCNTCHCHSNGAVSCTRKGCPPKNDSIFDQPCKPGSSWMVDCNSCRCHDNGAVSCSRMECIPKADVFDQPCEPGSSWKEDCNTCHCHSNGAVSCTRMGCPPKNDSSPHIERRDTSKSPDNTRHVISKRGVCKANQEFQVDCNSCKCSANGQSYTCTHNECLEGDNTNKEVEVFMENEGSDHIERHSVCKPRDTFYIACNICHCNAFGTDYTCTNKACPLPKDVELFHELKEPTTTSSNNTKTIVCVANRMFIRDCNTCWCNEDGTSYFCTRKVCIPDATEGTSTDDPNDEVKNLRVVMQKCRPNEVFELDCNMCRCNQDGTSYSCTRRACVETDDKNSSSKRKTRAIQEPPKQCQPGQEFRIDCNKCLCDNEGQNFSCTRIDCTAQNNNGGVDTFTGTRAKRDTTQTSEMTCSPGSVFDRDCNVCRCTDDGLHATCTLKLCKQNVTDTASTTEPAFRCTPGDQFKRECNDCTCSADGKNVFCTLRLCEMPEVNI